LDKGNLMWIISPIKDLNIGHKVDKYKMIKAKDLIFNSQGFW